MASLSLDNGASLLYNGLPIVALSMDYTSYGGLTLLHFANFTSVGKLPRYVPYKYELAFKLYSTTLPKLSVHAS